MAYDRISLGNRIAAARLNKDLTQLDMCTMLHISQSTYSKIENGKHPINIDILYEMSIIFDVKMSWLIGETIITDLTDKECIQVETFINYILSLRNK